MVQQPVKSLFIFVLALFLFGCEYYTSREITEAERLLVFENAKKEIGKPYVFGGNGPNAFDCSGLVVSILLNIGSDGFIVNGELEVDATANHLYMWNTYSINEPEVGDLAFWLNENDIAYHVGIVVDHKQNLIIDAYSVAGFVDYRFPETPVSAYGRIIINEVK